MFNTGNGVYPYMGKEHSGVIMGMTAVVSQIPFPYTEGFGPAWAGVEAMLRLLAAELGPQGVRTVCLHSPVSEGAANKPRAPTTHEPDEASKSSRPLLMTRNT